ncbi:PorP/SprF family type IX secretion system membrane protein [Catalinimonas niigatensis]|uniref:PorP/SprF family type IX secretion system membrane protein n=1 Tax=Catalinimonas niigatensis TaxID=1397264 RepID=UPI002665166A|nr:type IX secretion system membrane protein PorP/SprF [Catalinimonas niigatensis]WPP53141.1 type IX secretion system membrane protein PorP/SprF [Catalinimonas niigatensis]
MNKTILLVLVCITTIGLATSYGQQSAQFSQYMFNTLFYNPAYAGVEGVTTLTAFHRTQWAGYQPTLDNPGGINTQVVSLNTPILRLRSGFGLHIVNDNIGPLTNLEAQASFAYHLGVGNGKLSLGVRVGAFSQTVDYGQYRPVDPDDVLLQGNGRVSQLRPDFSAGVFYRARQYYLGVGFKHLIDSQFDFVGIDTLNNPLENHVTVTGGFDYEPTYKVRLTPSFLVQSDLNSYSFDVGVLATYDDTMWGGISFRQQEALVGMIGYSFFKEKSLKLGYSFDYVVLAQEAKAATSHEIMVTYSLPMSSASDKKIIRTPRFRQ